MLKSSPCTLTSPAVGWSSPPSRCSSVLLPEPELPTIATRSPAATSRSTPASTGTSTRPWRKVLRRLRHEIAGAGLFIAQRLHRVGLGRAPARVKRREERQQESHHCRDHHVGRLHL